MNRYLLAGAAAAALALGAGAANAQAKFEVKIGGDAYFEGGYVGQDLDSGTRSTEFRNRMRINIIPSAKADNGLEYGARLRLRANGNDRNTDADRAYMFAQGSFGQVRLGVTDSFNDDTYVTAPMDYLALGIYDGLPAWINTTGTNGNNINSGVANTVTKSGNIISPSVVVDGNATKIVYYSPRFAGIQFGASYTPRNDSSNTDINRTKPVASATTGNASGTFTDIVEVGANYNNTFSGVTLKASAGYFWGQAIGNSAGSNYKDLNAWQAGAQIGYAGFALGGGYVDYGKSGQNKIRSVFTEPTRNWNVGAQYTTGPIVVGLNYKNGRDAGSQTTAGERELQVYEIGVGYTVAPGLTVQAQYDYFKVNNDASAQDDKGNVVILRSVLAF
ncbi:hypothetical protein AZL_026260 [Azospirillum sp. B510]|uniref:porin n=1 Tax=Azospirillum sp. (strain B510) TaxID=137722 RepID=UPI0001C4CD04|nr:porin [Azospirillum sp. B510]BAI73264.1 hypothetical protein AZL_026260 [Azospirillum sp. B510]